MIILQTLECFCKDF